MTKIKDLYGLILAGGFSQRMGQDKSLLVYHGKPQIERVHDLLSDVCDRVFLSKRADQSAYASLLSIDDIPEYASIGPLGGMLSAMSREPKAAWLVMACDLPFVENATIRTLIEARDVSKIATAFVSVHDGLPEPLCAVWEPGAKAVIEEFLKKGIKCPRKILINSQVALLKQYQPRWLDNVNSIDEFNEAKAYLKGLR